MRKIKKVLAILCLMVMGLAVGVVSPGAAVVFEVDNDKDIISLQHEVEERVSNILHEELARLNGNRGEKSVVNYFRKEAHPHVTVVYDRGVEKRFEKSMFFMLRLMQSLKKGINRVEGVVVTNRADLYGRHGEFIVLHVNDTQQQLHRFRRVVCNSFLWLNHYYQSLDQPEGFCAYLKRFWQRIKNFFGQGEKERAAVISPVVLDYNGYSPHITLGKIAYKTFVQAVRKRGGQAKETWRLVQMRIRNEVFPLIKKRMVLQPLVFDHFVAKGNHRKFLGRFALR